MCNNGFGVPAGREKAPTQQVSDCSLFLGVNIPRRQNTQSHQVGEMECIMAVTAVLQAIVLLHRQPVNKAQIVTLFL
jgi:hypothetical protein